MKKIFFANSSIGEDKFINFDAAEDILNGHVNRETYGVQSIWSVITFQIWYKKFTSI